jgi:hypothetical protein
MEVDIHTPWLDRFAKPIDQPKTKGRICHEFEVIALIRFYFELGAVGLPSARG